MKSERKFVKILSVISESGYEGLQIEYDLLPDSLLREPKRVSSLIGDASLETVAVAITANPYNIHFTSEINGKVGTLCLFEKSFKEATRETQKLLRVCAKLGVKLAVHPHVRSNVETIQQVEDILASCDDRNLSLVFDSAHFTALGWDLTNFLERFHENISVVHIKDLRRLKSPSTINYNRDFVDIGDGIIDFDRLINSFKKIGYDGWLIMEVDHSQQANPAVSVKKNYDRLSSLV
ncbi:MAG: sugar phosphate isomerase/epimerase family protein [Nitrososphaerales archaeon]